MKALLVSVVVGLAAGQPPPKPAADEPDLSAEFDILWGRLKEQRPKAGKDDWAAVLRDLVLLGPGGTPRLIATLDETTDEFELRCLGFVARGVGDKRAVPALIRAFPRALAPPGSDYGLIAKDPELLRFMQRHDTDKGEGGTHYSFGRAYTEIRATLRKMTGANNGEDEMNFSLTGSPRQQYLQRELYHRCAVRWANWWEAHWKEFVADETYSRVNLPAMTGDVPPAPTAIPRGPGVTTDWHLGGVLQSVREPKARHVFLDLDTGREAALPERLRAEAGQPERFDDIAAWAAVEGFDLMGTEYRVPGDARPRYVLRGLGLAAWRLDGDRRKTLKDDLRGDQRLDLTRRVDGLLVGFDVEKGRYNPADTGTYLFRTREDGYGALFVGIEVHDNSAKNGGFMPRDTEFEPVAFSKGRRYAYTLIADGGDPAR